MAIIISLGQNMVVQNVILPRGLYFFTLFSVFYFVVVYPWFSTGRGRKADYLIKYVIVCICLMSSERFLTMYKLKE